MESVRAVRTRVAALARSRSFNLRSAFRPTYNMAANLVRSYTSEQAHHLLNLSFAQYQADHDVVRSRPAPSGSDERRRGPATAESRYGDIWEYRAEQPRSERSTAVRNVKPSSAGSVRATS